MPQKHVIPERLYKYRPFDVRTIELLVDDKVFYANPRDFNDPLDTRPTLNADIEVAELEQVLRLMVTRRVSAEMRSRASSINYRGPKTLDHIDRLSKAQASSLIDEIAYQSTDPTLEGAPEQHQTRMLARAIEAELLQQYDKGILSLASKPNCPLMWSHYGDQHRGICLGYSVPAAASKDMHNVRYSGSRLVTASDVQAMLNGDVAAQKRVDEGVLLRKAGAWRYEKEWRHLGERGLQNSPFELEEVIFGTRSPSAMRHTVVNALVGRERDVKFYRMMEVPGQFQLKRRPFDEDDFSSTPARSLSYFDQAAGFEDVSVSP